ncbi:phage tail protein [Lactiplantibacillus paraplantarum]|uniref:phage tail protein n=1 Tax=Lactiplantibacillus paraplantarum TaxID=60520 RepID=UPI0021D2734F|nr:phage tail protein [Lactiplantibacillus paraplantarum]MCU4683375.1 phage tail protein [Lactiplantibacillus paraplantarum]
MAESNATQVILTDDGIKIINAQSTADNAAGGVANLNDPNLMSVIEKQTQATQYAGLTSQYNVIISRTKYASISTADLTTAYTNLNTFMTAILTDTTKASDVNRDTYKSLTDAYNTALSNVQTALSNSFNTDIDNMQSSVSVASQAASSAVIVASQAATAGNSASQAASQAASAASKSSADYTALSSGVKDGSVVHITTKTVIDDAVIGTAEIVNAAITDAKIGNISANHLTAGTIDFNTITGKNINASNITTGTLGTDRLNVGKLSALSADLGTVTAGIINGLDIVAKTFSTANGTFMADSNGNITASSIYLVGNKNLVYNSELLGNAAGWSLNNAVYLTTTAAHDGTATLGMNNTAFQNTWNTMAISKQMTIMSSAANSNISLSGWMFVGSLATGTTTACMVVELLDSSGNRVSANFAKADLSKLGQWQRVTVSGGTIPSGAVKVRVLYQIYGPGGNIYWSQPMISNSSNWQGYTSDTGNVVSAGEIDGSVINGSTINGGTLNMQTDGLINSPYTGIEQTADQFYHPWKLNTGQLTIGQGYITSVSSGTRSINGVPKQFNSLQGTLSASYLKFTNDYGARTYIDADMFTYSNQTNDTAMVAISAGGIGINMGTPHAPALTISNGYIDASSSSSYGVFGAITLGYTAQTINSDSSIFFESGHGSGNPGINIWAKGFQSLSSRLSTKRQVRLLDDEHSNSLLLGADTATFKYNQDTNADNPNEGVIIDDVNTSKQYSLPNELMTRDGKAPTDLMSFIARVISQNKYQARLIEDLQIRLRKVEIKNE